MTAKKQTTSIEWVKNSDGTQGYAINLWIGCSKISPACDNCYAEKCNPYKKLTTINKKAEKQNIRIRVFINPDSDIFDNKAPQEWRDEFWHFVYETPYIDYILVTKRIGNAKNMIPANWFDNGYPTNVWQLITVCNQAEADRDIPKLLELDVSVRGLSIEPMLGEIDLYKTEAFFFNRVNAFLSNDGKDGSWVSFLDWVVLGGESGKNARSMNP